MRKIVLLGYMGSGKSTVGKALSSVLSIPFVDLDQRIEEVEAMPVSDLFASKGEIYFRRKESETLLSLIHSDQPMVIATGGGTPCYGNTMTDLLQHQQVTTVYLKVDLPVLVTRLAGEKSSRPLISHLETQETLHDFIRKHLFERSYYYSQSEHIITANEKVGEIVEAIVGKLF